MTTWKGGQLRVGVIGAGMITTVSYGFLPGLQTISDRVQVVAIASRTRSLAEKVATDFNIRAVYDSLSDMLADAEPDAVINATPGPAHYATSIEILSAGKHLITDKPLASTVAEADEMCALAEANERLIVCAPYDMLSREWREPRRLIAAGAVGKVTFAWVQSSHAGPAGMAWPSDPTWFYQQGAGPLVGMGVYGLVDIIILMSDKIRRGVDPTSVPRQGSCLRRVFAMPSDLRSLGAVSVTTDSGRVRARVHDC